METKAITGTANVNEVCWYRLFDVPPGAKVQSIGLRGEGVLFRIEGFHVEGDSFLGNPSGYPLIIAGLEGLNITRIEARAQYPTSNYPRAEAWAQYVIA